jgi:hypothetical protein
VCMAKRIWAGRRGRPHRSGRTRTKSYEHDASSHEDDSHIRAPLVFKYPGADQNCSRNVGCTEWESPFASEQTPSVGGVRLGSARNSCSVYDAVIFLSSALMRFTKTSSFEVSIGVKRKWGYGRR